MATVQPSGGMKRRGVGDLLVRKLNSAHPLGAEARRALRNLPSTLQRYRRQNVIAESGRAPDSLMMVLDGYAARVKVTRWGEQPIVGFLLPGDLIDWPLLALKTAGGATRNAVLDHTVCAINTALVAVFRPPAVMALLETWPEVRRALDATALIERNITHEWLANLAGRPAPERLAHLLCEHFHRMRTMELTEGDSCPLPFSQARLSASQGLSTVHTNRLLRRLRADGLLEVQGRRLTVLDLPRLESFADFSPEYLTCSGKPGSPPASRGRRHEAAAHP
jgi:CRP-like cAMP-binding protein